MTVLRDRLASPLLVACLLGALHLVSFAVSPAHAAAEPEMGHEVLFDLAAPEVEGVLDPSQPLRLTIRLTGVRQADDSLVTIIEGPPFVRQLVPMEPAGVEETWQSTVRLEPSPPGVVSFQGRAVRVTATFARLQGMRLERFLARSVYVTTALPAKTAGLHTAPFRLERADPGGEPASPLDTGGTGGQRGGEAFSEKDLIPDAPSADAQVYWRRVSRRVGRMWTEAPARASTAQAPGVVGVRFRLHANGEAQLIQIERSSGVPELDEAGLQAVLRAHPFPPFPPDLPHESVTLHIELGHPLAPPPSPRPPLPSQAAR